MIKRFLQNALHVANKCQRTMKGSRQDTKYLEKQQQQQRNADLKATKASCLQSI